MSTALHRPLHSARWRILTALVACCWSAGPTMSGGETTGSGADVTVYELTGSRHWGFEGTTHAYSVGTVACNQGTEPISWCDDDNRGCLPGATVTDHPVIGQNLYRLKDGRFEQIGMSWLKHGFNVVPQSGAGCGTGACDQSLFDRDHLEVGCTDAYSAGLNGLQPLGRRSQVNPATGEHPARPANGGDGIAERLQVDQADIDPGLNPAARYWIEGQYLAPDDARDGNGLNNTSHRDVRFAPGTLDLILVGSTQRGAPAIAAWQTADPHVELVTVDLPGHQPPERFHAARRVSGQPGDWHHEYVIHNLNSDRGAAAFEIRFPVPTDISNVGFKDIDHHSGEPYDTGDWAIEIDGPGGRVRWSTDTHAINEDANALRWGTLFSFWFDSDQPLAGVVHTLELFKPGAASQVNKVLISFPDAAILFSDDLESGDASNWSGIVD